MNTHTHFDHAGGVREYAAEGITIITHEMNRSYYEKIWERPHTVKPDRLSQNPRTPRWETMTDRKTVTDGTRTLELYKLVGNGHNPYILIGYLPAERILLYGDMYNPPSGPDPRDGHKPRRDGQGVCGRRYCCVVATAAGFSPLAIRSTSFCAIGRLTPQLGSLMRQAARVSDGSPAPPASTIPFSGGWLGALPEDAESAPARMRPWFDAVSRGGDMVQPWDGRERKGA